MSKSAREFSALSHPFRLFFLLTGLYGLITVIAWISYLFGGLNLPVGWSAIHWHGHEMLFGLATAAIAGFLLTAMCNWTGAAPLQGIGLLGLAAIWLLGRVAMWTAAWWPSGLVALMDLLFLPIMAAYVLRVLLRHGNRKNLVMVAILIALSLANGLMHAGFINLQTHWLVLGEITAFNLITLMMVIIGGRIIPLFTKNWLKNNGRESEDVKSHTAIDALALVTTAALLPADFIAQTPAITGALAGIAAVAHFLRLSGWAGWKARHEPLLWVLHLGYGWIIFALALKSLAAFGLVAPAAWLHALGVGGMATLILGIMTRVSLGHTGRPLRLPRFAVVIYYAITLAAIVRVAAATQLIEYRTGLFIAAAGWSLAFAVFLIIYWPILNRPRVDGRAG